MAPFKTMTRIVPMKNRSRLLFVLACLLGGCAARTSSSGTDSDTQFWDTCSQDSECGELSCLCGRCTVACSAADVCGDFAAAACDAEARFCANAGAVCVSGTFNDEETEQSPTSSGAADSGATDPSSSEEGTADDVSGAGDDSDAVVADGGNTPVTSAPVESTPTPSSDVDAAGPANEGSADSSTADAPTAEAGTPEVWPMLPLDEGQTIAEGFIYELALAVTANDGALVFSRSTDDATIGVFLQPLALDGTADGDAIELGVGEGPSVATDGERYVACWHGASTVSCSAIDLSTGDVEPVLDVAGMGAAVSYGFDRWVVAYGTGQEVNHPLVLQPFSATFEAEPSVTMGEVLDSERPSLIATAEGFLLIDTDLSNDYSLRGTPLDAALQPVGEPVLWGVRYWMRPPAVFIDETQIVLSAPEAYGAQIVSEGGQVKATLSGGGKEGLSATLIDAEGPVVCWVNSDIALQRERVTALDLTAELDFGVTTPRNSIVSARLGERQVVFATAIVGGAEGNPIKRIVLD